MIDIRILYSLSKHLIRKTPFPFYFPSVYVFVGILNSHTIIPGPSPSSLNPSGPHAISSRSMAHRCSVYIHTHISHSFSSLLFSWGVVRDDSKRQTGVQLLTVIAVNMSDSNPSLRGATPVGQHLSSCHFLCSEAHGPPCHHTPTLL